MRRENGERKKPRQAGSRRMAIIVVRTDCVRHAPQPVSASTIMAADLRRPAGTETCNCTKNASCGGGKEGLLNRARARLRQVPRLQRERPTSCCPYRIKTRT